MNEADRRREFELDILRRVEDLESIDRNGAIAKNVKAMRETIENWNEQFTLVNTRLDTMENNFLNCIQKVKDIERSNTLALQRLVGHGPTA